MSEEHGRTVSLLQRQLEVEEEKVEVVRCQLAEQATTTPASRDSGSEAVLPEFVHDLRQVERHPAEVHGYS